MTLERPQSYRFHNGGAKDARDVARRPHARFLVQGRDDRGRAAHGFVLEIDGVARRDVAEAVVVDDLEDLGLLDAVDGLALLVVVDQDDLLASGRDEVLP